jgi:hypothetical protein
MKISLDTFRESTYRQPSLTEPQLFPEPYRLKTTFGSVHLKTTPNSNTTFNALLSTSSPCSAGDHRHDSSTSNGKQESERKRSNTTNAFEMIRRGSGSGFPTLFNSMEIPEMKGGEGSCDQSFGLEEGQQIRPTVRSSEEELDEEQLDHYVNEILGGVADMEEVGN